MKNFKSVIPDPALDDFEEGEESGLTYALKLVEELGKIVVPKFVADWYEENKSYFEWSLYNLCDDFNKRRLQEDLQVRFTDNTNKPIETLVMMNKFGYVVEGEEENEND